MKLEKYSNKYTLVNKDFDSWLEEQGRFTNIMQIIEKDCSEFLTHLLELKDKLGPIKEDYVLYRGYRNYYNRDIVKLSVRKDRTPSHTDNLIHKTLGKYSEEIHGWNMRKEGVFATSDINEASIYGSPFLFFPAGDYQFLYDPFIDDLYRHIKDENLHKYAHGGKDDTEYFEDRIRGIVSKYKDDNLARAIMSGVEISFNCDYYYLVNNRYLSKFISYINNK